MTDVMTSKERVLAAINLQESDRVPCCVGLAHFVARHAKVTIAEYMANPGLQMNLQHKAFEDLGGADYIMGGGGCGGAMDPVMMFSALPIKMKLPGKDLDPDSIPQFAESELMPAGAYDTVIEKGWIRYVKEELYPSVYPDYQPPPPPPPMEIKYDPEQDRRFYEDRNVYIGSGGITQLPYEVLSFARSLEKFAPDLYRQPDKVIAAMDAMLPELIDMGLAGIKTPGEPIAIAASRCSSYFLSPKHFERFTFPYMKKMAEAYVSRGSPVLFHLDTNWTKFLPYFRELPEGKYVLQFDGTSDIFKAKEVLGDRMCIMGDVPATLFKLGTTQEVEAYCRKLIDVVGKGGGFILAAGCGVPDDAKFENVKAMVDTAKNYHPRRR